MNTTWCLIIIISQAPTSNEWDCKYCHISLLSLSSSYCCNMTMKFTIQELQDLLITPRMLINNDIKFTVHNTQPSSCRYLNIWRMWNPFFYFLQVFIFSLFLYYIFLWVTPNNKHRFIISSLVPPFLFFYFNFWILSFLLLFYHVQLKHILHELWLPLNTM